jgi:hypothetical protein
MSHCDQLHPGIPTEQRKNARGCKHCILETQRIRRSGLEPPTVCKSCNVSFPTGRNRIFCEDCAPTRADWERIKKYGVDRVQYDAMYFEQNGSCAICLIREATDLDHNHTTGAPRQLLCRDCNVSIGKLLEDPSTLRRAAEYLETWNG